MRLRHILLGAAASSLGRLGGAGRARVGRPGQHPLLAGGLDHDPVPLERHQGHPGREPRARAARPLRREGRDGALPRRDDPDGRERRRLAGPAQRSPGSSRTGCSGPTARRSPPTTPSSPGSIAPTRTAAAPSCRTSATSPSVEAVDPQTIKITFGVPKPFPYGPLVGAQSPILQKKQFADCLGAKAPTCTEANTKPIGTGPFTVTDFKANDVVTLAANPNYRDPAKPAFATVGAEGRRRRGERGALGARDRRVRLCLERPGRAGDPRADGRRREGRGALGLRLAGRAPAGQPDRPRPGARRRALDRWRTRTRS